MTAPQIPLKPCPCCGSTAVMHTNADGWNWVECTRCYLATQYRISAGDDCRPLVAEAWNRRTPAPAPEQEELPL